MSTQNTRVQVDFKNDKDALKALLSRAEKARQSTGKQLLIEYLAGLKKGATK